MDELTNPEIFNTRFLRWNSQPMRYYLVNQKLRDGLYGMIASSFQPQSLTEDK